MATKRFCDRCHREINWGTTGRFHGAWGANLGMDHVETKQLMWATFRKELCGDCANAVEDFICNTVRKDQP
jgi:hypothetical protein